MQKGQMLMTLLLASIVMGGCSTQESQFVVLNEQDSAGTVQKPSLEVSVDVEGNQATVSIVTDLQISKDLYGKEKKEGFGHIHVYLDNGEKQGITDTPHILKDLSSGPHTVRVSLHNNDHTPYDVVKTVNFNVK